MKPIKIIKSKEGQVHFKRWQLFSCKRFAIYIHGIYVEDRDLHLHNHPWNIWTIILWGGYQEELFDPKTTSTKFIKRRFGHSGFRDSSQFHKIHSMFTVPTITLAIVGRRLEKPWGYLTENGFVDYKTYRDNKNR